MNIKKTPWVILEIPSGIIIFVSDEHSKKKGILQISVTHTLIVILISDEQSLNTYLPILVIELGIVMDLISCSINVLLFSVLIDPGNSIPINTFLQIKRVFQ